MTRFTNFEFASWCNHTDSFKRKLCVYITVQATASALLTSLNTFISYLIINSALNFKCVMSQHIIFRLLLFLLIRSEHKHKDKYQVSIDHFIFRLHNAHAAHITVVTAGHYLNWLKTKAHFLLLQPFVPVEVGAISKRPLCLCLQLAPRKIYFLGVC